MTYMRSVSPRRILWILSAFFGFALMAVLSPAQTSPDQPTTTPAASRALVRVTLSGAYNDSAEQAAILGSIAKQLPPTVVDIPPNDTISAFVSRQYGLGRSDGFSQIYESFERAILDLNGIEDPTEWKPGKRLAPLLPHWAKTDFNSKKSANKLAVVTTTSLATIQAQNLDFALTVPRIINRPADAPQKFSFDMEVSSEIAQRLMSMSPDAYQGVLIGRPLLLNDTMTVHFADNTNQGDGQTVVPDGIKTRLSSLATKIHNKQSLLFVLDSGWPVDARQQSIQMLKAIIESVRQSYKLGPAYGQVNVDGNIAKPVNDHCINISKSLSDLQSIDNGNIVKVIFVPLSKEQNSVPILSELLYTHFLAISIDDSELGKADLSASQFADIRKGARADTQKAIRDTPDKAEGSQLPTAKAILD